MLSIGLDVHQNLTALCELDGDGRVTGERVIRGGFHAVADHLKALGEPFKVCFEASCGYGTLYDLLIPIAAEVQVAHPTELKLIFRSKHKNDRNDARKLARLLHMQAVPRVHVPPMDVRAWRSGIERRRRLVDERTRCKNGLRAMLRGLAIAAPRGRSLWTKDGVAWLAQLELPTVLHSLDRDALIARLRLLDEQIKAYERELDAIAARDWRVALLRTIPGVGVRTAEAVVAYIDDPDRFSRVRSIGKYFGVVPSQDASAGRNRLGHITRQGPPTVRKMLTQAAWQAVRRSPSMKAYYQHIRADQKQRTGTALIATGHKLLRCMLAMLRKRQEWREEVIETHDAAAALPTAASANCTEARRPRRRGRGKGSAVKVRRRSKTGVTARRTAR